MSIESAGYIFETEDFGQAVALLCMDYEVARLRREPDTKRVTFCFKRREGIDQAALDYWSGNLQISAKRFWSESKNLKSRLYSEV